MLRVSVKGQWLRLAPASIEILRKLKAAQGILNKPGTHAARLICLTTNIGTGSQCDQCTKGGATWN